MRIDRERAAMLGVWALAALGAALGLLFPPMAAGASPSLAHQALDALRVLCAAALVVALLLGPGIVIRGTTGRRIGLGYLPLPGLALLLIVGGLAWATASAADPSAVCFAVLGPVLLGLLLGLLTALPGQLLDRDERYALLVVGCALGLAVARSLWSLGAEGELYAGTISRTLEVGDRPDSRIPFHVVQLIANGSAPYSEIGSSYFAPYNFSSRGPLAGVASAPIVLVAGGRPPTVFPDQAWSPFDPQGFMAYRLTMMAFASTAFLSLWTLTARLGGRRAARFALLLAATTPFLVHEVWFTWPKLLAASLVLLAANELIAERPLRSGVLVGIGYLVHPIALLSLPALGLIALWPLSDARLSRPRLAVALRLAAGVAVWLLAWRLVNGSHFMQNDFLNYFTDAGPNVHSSTWGWFVHRLHSTGNTVVPFALFLFSGSHPSVNVVGGTSPSVIHFFFQYWNTLPFGVALFFFPLLLVGLWRAWRAWKWPVTAAVIVPFAIFAIYWGSYSSGMMREGLHTWALTLLAVVALQQASAGFPWLRSIPIRALLSLRAASVLAIAVIPTLATRSSIADGRYAFTDVAAFVAMEAFAVGLAVLVWSAGKLARDAGADQDTQP